MVTRRWTLIALIPGEVPAPFVTDPTDPTPFQPRFRFRRHAAWNGGRSRLSRTPMHFESASPQRRRPSRAAAFRDPRFSHVTQEELGQLEYHVSILSKPVPIRFTSEADLLAQIRPGVDGLILHEGPKKGTLLPAVWDHLHDPVEFLAQLKLKAGLPRDYWSSTVRVERYTAQSVHA